MGRSPCCDEIGLKKGHWTPQEDEKLVNFVHKHGHASWRALPKLAGLNRCGKSCRLRWTNYLRPGIKRGTFSPEEEHTILNLHAVLGNKWSAIANYLSGRTDNEVKNFWNTHLKKKLIQMGIDPMTHRPRTEIFSSLTQLIALANLMDHPLLSSSYEEQAVKLQTEVAKLQCLQYFLQPPCNNNYPIRGPTLDTTNTLNLNHNTSINLDDPNPYYGTHDRLLDLHSLEESPTLVGEKIVGITNFDPEHQTGQPCESMLLSQEENYNHSPNSPWLPFLSSSPSPAPSLSFLTTAATITPATTAPLVDDCSNDYGGTNNTYWPHLILDENSLFHHIMP